MRCLNCPSKGCYNCPMFGVGENPEYKRVSSGAATQSLVIVVLLYC